MLNKGFDTPPVEFLSSPMQWPKKGPLVFSDIASWSSPRRNDGRHNYFVVGGIELTRHWPASRSLLLEVESAALASS